jgi:hypothetical protein
MLKNNISAKRRKSMTKKDLERQLAGREAEQAQTAIFKPTGQENRVRIIPVKEDQVFYELSSVRLNDTYFTLPFRKTKKGEKRHPDNYYTELIGPVYEKDSALYTEVKQKDKYIFYVVEIDSDNRPIPNKKTGDVLQVFYPSPGLGHLIVEKALDLPDGLDPFSNPGVALKVITKKNRNTGFNDYSESHFEDEMFVLENWDELTASAAAKDVPAKLAKRSEVEQALKNRIQNRVALAYTTLGQTTSKASSAAESEDGEYDEFEKGLMSEIDLDKV